MEPGKNVSRITENVLINLYGKQPQEERLRFLVSLYMGLDEAQQDAFLRIVTDEPGAKDRHYQHR